MFPPSGSDHPGALPGGGPPDRRGELVQLTHDLAHELQARGGTLRQLGYMHDHLGYTWAQGGAAVAWVRAPDGTTLELILRTVTE